jgi:enoyl-CoA hydratase/carnithine racemase
MEYKEIIQSMENGLVRLSLNRPDKVNPLTQAMVRELSQALDAIAGDPEVRAVILGAEGKHFSAGHFLGEMVDRSTAAYREIFESCSAMMQKIHDLPQPVIAQVQGVATAAGCQLVAACDLAVAADNVRFGTPGVRIGLFCSTPAVPLVRAVGRKRAMDMLLTGRWVKAPEALEWGLVNRVVPLSDLARETEALARHIMEASPITLAVGKKTFYDQVDRPEGEAYNTATTAMGLGLSLNDAQEGIKAFLEKRDPTWSGS